MKKIIKNKLTQIYSPDMVKSIMCGRAKPNAEIRYQLSQELNVPFEAWLNMKTYLKELDETKGGQVNDTQNG